MAAPEDTFRFVCRECGYKARIPDRFANMHIKCPGCNTTQQATPDDAAAATGDTVTIQRVDQAQPEPLPKDKFRFNCDACGYRARMPVKYIGMAIKCPSCGKPQMARPGEDDAGDQSAPKPVTDKFLFQCGSCAYRARLPVKYQGQHIKCPGCGSTQQATPLDDSAPPTGDTVSIQRVDVSPKEEINDDEEPRIVTPVAPSASVAAPADEEPTIAPPAPAQNAGDAAADDVTDPPVQTDAAQSGPATGGELELEFEFEAGSQPEADSAATGSPGPDTSEQSEPAVLPPPPSAARAAEQDDTPAPADKPLEFDPFAKDREPESQEVDPVAAELLAEMRSSSSRRRPVAKPAAQQPPPTPAPPPAGTAASASPQPQGPGPNQPTADPAASADKPERKQKKPTAARPKAPAQPPAQPAPTVVKRGGKGLAVFLLLLLLAALGGGGWLFLQWTAEKEAREGTAHAQTAKELSDTRADLTATRRDLASLREQLQQTETERDATRAELQAERSGAEGTAHAATMATLASTKQTLETAEDELLTTSKELEQKLTELTDTRGELEAASAKVEDLKSSLATTANELEQAIEARKKAEGLLDDLRSELQESSSQKAALQRQLDKLRQTAGGLLGGGEDDGERSR